MVPDVRVLRNQKLETLHAAVFVVAVGGVRGGLAPPREVEKIKCGICESNAGCNAGRAEPWGDGQLDL